MRSDDRLARSHWKAAMTATPPAAELRRCPSCDRGDGGRLGADRCTVALHPTAHRGPGQNGRWHGALRGPC